MLVKKEFCYVFSSSANINGGSGSSSFTGGKLSNLFDIDFMLTLGRLQARKLQKEL